jgi:phage protein U
MSLVLMRLGPHVFYVPYPGLDTPSFQTLSRDSNFTLPSQGRLSRDPAIQFTGPGEDVVVIEGVLWPHHFGGIGDPEATEDGPPQWRLGLIEALRQSGRKGEKLQMVRLIPLNPGYAGEISGPYLIRRVRENQSKIGASGMAHKIDFTVELVAYGDDLINDTSPADGDFTFL